MDPSSSKRSHVSSGTTPNKPAEKRARDEKRRIRKPLDFSSENVTVSSEIGGSLSPENVTVSCQVGGLLSPAIRSHGSPSFKVVSSGLKKSPLSAVKSPVRLHKWSFDEERALVEFVGLALMDPKYGITSTTQWPAFRPSHHFWADTARCNRLTRWGYWSEGVQGLIVGFAWFVALALGYFPPGELGEFPPYFELEYFEEAAHWLSNHPKVLPGGIGLHAICFGSWIALLLASFRSDVIKATVAISSISVASLSRYKYREKLSKILPCDNSKLIVTEHGVVVRHSLPPVTEDNGSVSEFSVITPSENISRPVLLVFGTGDLNVNSDFCANQVYERMKKNGKGHLYSVLRYPGAGHLIEPPYIPHHIFITCSTGSPCLGRRDRGACASASRCLAKDYNLSEKKYLSQTEQIVKFQRQIFDFARIEVSD